MRCHELWCLVAVVGVLAAGDPDPRTQVRNVWTEASRTGDLWTCLQAEEWGRTQKPALKIGPVLGGVVVAGSTLLALPEHVRLCADLGDRVVTSTDRRVWVMAPDGRPLQRSVPLAVASWNQAVGFGGRAMVSARHDVPEVGPGVLRAATQLIEEGRPKGPPLGSVVLPLERTFERSVRMEWRLAVADDGSAMAVELAADGGPVAFGRQVMIVSSRGQEMIRNAWGPSAVGRGGCWAVVSNDEGQDLVRGQRRERIGSPSAGPGMVAGWINKAYRLVLADGTDRPLDPGLGLGSDTGLASVGNWLVMFCGYGAKAQAEGDLLGANAAQEETQPPTLALWRWADLAADPAAKPVTTIIGALSVANDHQAGLLVWADKTVDLVDLSGREPRRSRRAVASSPVRWARVDKHALVIELGDGKWSLHGPDGAELWTGSAEGISVRRQDLALTWRPGKEEGTRSWQLQRLAADPAKRGESALDLPLRGMDVEVGFRGADWAVGRGENRWRRLALDGQLMDQGEQNPPSTPQWDPWRRGRFFSEGGHLIAKAATRDEYLEHLFLQDAWRFGTVTALLDDRGRVLANSKSFRGEYGEIGLIPNGNRFGMAAKTPVIITPQDNQVAGVFNTGPRAVTQIPPNLPRVEEMPPGPWKLEGGNVFIIPRGKQMRWNTDRVGFEPQRLRSPPEGAGLFAVTRTVLLEFDPEAAKAVGSVAP